MAKPERIAIFGLGYVGAVSAGCFARLGFEVIGVDVDETKVDRLGRGQSPVTEEGLESLIAEQHHLGRIRATLDPLEAVAESDLCLVCVGTPSAANGSVDVTYVRRVCEQIGEALRETRAGGGSRAERFYVVVVRSTVPPGTVTETLIPILEERSGMRAGVDFGVAQNPEFLREGSAIHDFFHPPKTVIGATDPQTASIVGSLYEQIEAPTFVVDIGVASMVKYADNAFHAVKVAFANEIGRLCKRFGVDSHEVMRIFCEDRKLNISPAYLRPGFAFGGSCLPKDLRALLYAARSADLELPLLSSLLPSNRLQVDALVEQLLPYRREGIGLLGLSFKPGTDDLRESPMVTVVESLLGRGAEVRIHDPNLRLGRLVGSNLRYIMTEIPHIGQLLKETPEEVIRASRAIVVAHGTEAFARALRNTRPDQVVFDLVRLADVDGIPARYVGLHW